VCFSATVNFVGSAALGTAGVVTLTKVKHRRELLFAALPLLFAIHQFIEGFVWLGLDGILSPTAAHDMGAAFMLYAQGLLPFLAPLSILLFEPNKRSRRRMLPFVVLGGATTLYILWGVNRLSSAALCPEKQHRVHQPGDQQHCGGVALSDCHLWSAVFLRDQDDGDFWCREPRDLADRDGGQALCIHIGMVRVRGGRERDYLVLLLDKP
jgi:hypothetical protein